MQRSSCAVLVDLCVPAAYFDVPYQSGSGQRRISPAHTEAIAKTPVLKSVS